MRPAISTLSAISSHADRKISRTGICRVGTEQFPSSTPTHFCCASSPTMSKRDQRDTLRRHRAFRPPLQRFLIVCEGTQTEPGYFQETRHLERSVIDLEMSPGGEPKALV